MSVRQPVPASAPNSPTCTPQPGVKPWPIGGSVVCQPVVPTDSIHGNKGNVLLLDITFKLPKGLELSEDVRFALLYIVNGSLDYSDLFSQTEISRNSRVTIPKGKTEVSITLLTLPIPPNTTFELEIFAAPTGAGTIISGPVQEQADVSESPAMEAAEDKSLKALNVLATTALVTALGALAFALLGRPKD